MCVYIKQGQNVPKLVSSFSQKLRPTRLLYSWRAVRKMRVDTLFFFSVLGLISVGYAAEWDYRDILSVDHIISCLKDNLAMKKLKGFCGYNFFVEYT